MANSNDFFKSLTFVLGQEGGYSNSKSDKGGETNFGVTWSTYNTYRKLKSKPLKSVKLIEKEEVEEIYFSLYWLPAGCNKLPKKLALCHFDWAVNHGVFGATELLQRIVGSKEDGKFGKNTLAATERSLNIHGENWLCGAYCVLREHYYRQRSTGDDAKHLEGWINRIMALRKEVSAA